MPSPTTETLTIAWKTVASKGRFICNQRDAHHRLEDGGIQRTLHLAPARHGEVEGRCLPKPLSERRAAIDVPDEGPNRRSSRAI